MTMADLNLVGVYNVAGYQKPDLQSHPISRQRKAFSSEASLTPGMVLSDKLVLMKGLHPWLHIQLFPGTLIHVPLTSRYPTIVKCPLRTSMTVITEKIPGASRGSSGTECQSKMYTACLVHRMQSGIQQDFVESLAPPPRPCDRIHMACFPAVQVLLNVLNLLLYPWHVNIYGRGLHRHHSSLIFLLFQTIELWPPLRLPMRGILLSLGSSL